MRCDCLAGLGSTLAEDGLGETADDVGRRCEFEQSRCVPLLIVTMMAEQMRKPVPDREVVNV